jgi:Flp pilus assembly protein TadG
MRKALKDKAGGIPIIFIGLVFVLLLMAFLIMEMGAAYENYYDTETILQRCCNSAVEKNLVDEYRADHILYLDVSGAKTDFYSFLESDMPEKLTVAVSSITGTAMPPNLIVRGTITFSTLFHQYGFDDVSFDFVIEASNYRVE